MSKLIFSKNLLELQCSKAVPDEFPSKGPEIWKSRYLVANRQGFESPNKLSSIIGWHTYLNHGIRIRRASRKFKLAKDFLGPYFKVPIPCAGKSLSSLGSKGYLRNTQERRVAVSYVEITGRQALRQVAVVL